MDILLVYTTLPTRNDAEKLRDMVLEARLAGCVDIWQIESKYWWKGKLEVSEEYAMLVKTKPELEEPLVKFIQDNHPYSTPVIARWNVRVNEDYYNWLFDETR